MMRTGAPNEKGSIMIFTSKTRGNVSVKNKPQIYLHTSLNENTICDEMTELLLSHEFGVNASIWTSDTTPRSIDEPKLSMMDLFVIAVTEELIDKELEYTAELILFAWEKHISVMPVYYVSGSSKNPYGRRFIEAVSKAVSTLTLQELRLELDGPVYSSRDFKHHFSNKLKKLVIPEELTEEIISSAFCRRLFLSYRKKDREKALAVMKAIHDLPLCQSIAIWFDDFLTAGRDFNKEIEEQLISADAFLLAVTPNLFENPNYVFKTEYPSAVVHQKKMVAVEAAPTDHTAFAEMYPEISKAVPVWDVDALKEKLMSVLLPTEELKEPARRQKYLLGMAYLSGVLVEKDPQRAFKLMKESAEDGEADAALQLSFMYLSHTGVARDNQAALLWQEKGFRLALQAAQAGDNTSIETAYKAALGTDGLVLQKAASGETEEAREICQSLRQMLERYPQSGKILQWDAECLLAEADVHFDDPEKLTDDVLSRRLARAFDAYQLLRQEGLWDDDARYLEARTFIVMGDIVSRLKNPEEAILHLQNAEKILMDLAEKAVPQYSRSLAYVFTLQGNILKAQFRYKEAMQLFERAIPINEALYSERQLPSDRENLAYAYFNYGLLAEDFHEGTQKVKEAIALMEDVVADNPQDVYLRTNLDEMKQALIKQQKKPLIAALVRWGIRLAFLAVIGLGIWYIARELFA